VCSSSEQVPTRSTTPEYYVYGADGMRVRGVLKTAAPTGIEIVEKRLDGASASGAEHGCCPA
jgi:hypothetical protein